MDRNCNNNMVDVKFITANDGTFFDLIDLADHFLITDYHALKKKIIFSGNLTPPNIGENKKRLQINSINALRNALNGYISAAQQILRLYCFIDCSDIDGNLLAEQIIFDILFDKYVLESEKMALYTYASSEHIQKILNTDGLPIDITADKVRNRIKRGMKNYSDRIKNSPQLQEELSQLGIEHNIYERYFSPKASENAEKKKAVYAWDFLYCNQYMITSRQYRRQLKEDGNYSAEAFVKDLKDYRNFINKILPTENESPKKYFEKTMNYYFLESYKRIDFIFKLMGIIPKIKAADCEYTFLVKRFHPAVLIPYEKDGRLSYANKCNYYRPLFMIEDELHKQVQNSDIYDESLYGVRLSNHQLIRAKVYELFRYHAEYVSSDYKDIKNFISQHYNMLSYHQSNKIWNQLPDKPWNTLDKETQNYFRTLKKDFIPVNELFFHKLPERKSVIS